jgi:hypothetical protein
MNWMQRALMVNATNNDDSKNKKKNERVKPFWLHNNNN